MGTFNEKGVAFIHERTRPLAVNSMEDAAAAIAFALAKGPSPSITPEQWARHLAWIIGFDDLIDDRKALHAVTSLLIKGNTH